MCWGYNVFKMVCKVWWKEGRFQAHAGQKAELHIGYVGAGSHIQHHDVLVSPGSWDWLLGITGSVGRGLAEKSRALGSCSGPGELQYSRIWRLLHVVDCYDSGPGESCPPGSTFPCCVTLQVLLSSVFPPLQPGLASWLALTKRMQREYCCEIQG